jgi:hypothetical protein
VEEACNRAKNDHAADESLGSIHGRSFLQFSAEEWGMGLPSDPRIHRETGRPLSQAVK